MTVTIDDFAKLDIRIGRVVEAREMEGSEKILRCVVDFGPAPVGAGLDPSVEDSLLNATIKDGRIIRVIFSGIKKWYTPGDLVGKLLPYIVNLEPRKMFGEESQGMLLAAVSEEEEKTVVLMSPLRDVATGTKVI